MTEPKGKLPWYKRFPERYLMATRDLTAEERGVYNDVLELLYAKNRRLADDARWIAGFVGVSVRRWKQIRQGLLDSGKLLQFGDYLSNGEFEKHRVQSDEFYERAAMLGHLGGKKRALNERKRREELARSRQQSLPLREENLGNPPAEAKGPLKGTLENAEETEKPTSNESFRRVFDDFSEDFIALKQSTIGGNPPAEVKPARSRESRVRGLEDRSSILSAESYEPRDLLDDTQRLAGLAGVSVIQPSKLASAMDVVKRWTADGLDLENVVAPAITRRVADLKPTERVHSLAYFDEPVRAFAARKRKSAPPKPVELRAKDEGEVGPYRQALRQLLGPESYEGWFHSTAWALNGKSLTVTTHSAFAKQWLEDNFKHKLAKVAGGLEVRIVTEAK